VGTVVGVHKGAFRVLLQEKPELISAEGGMYLGDLGKKRGYGFAMWNMIWDQSCEAHVDPHRYVVRLYRFDKKAGGMVKTADLKTRKKYLDGRGALHKEFGIDYTNLLQSIFGNCR